MRIVSKLNFKTTVEKLSLNQTYELRDTTIIIINIIIRSNNNSNNCLIMPTGGHYREFLRSMPGWQLKKYIVSLVVRRRELINCHQ